MDGADIMTLGLPRSEHGTATLQQARDSLSKLGKAIADGNVSGNIQEHVEDAARLTDVDPTAAQREAGNYRKGKVTIHGLAISIENPRGSYREGTGAGGRKWRTRMSQHYGYITRTNGRDDDPVDVFIGPDPASEIVFVINQVDPASQKFDEHKCMLGFTNEAAARKGYLSCYEKGWQGLGSVRAMTMAEFKKWILQGDHDKRAAIEGEYQGTAVKPENEGGAELSILTAEDEETNGQNIVHAPLTAQG